MLSFSSRSHVSPRRMRCANAASQSQQQDSDDDEAPSIRRNGGRGLLHRLKGGGRNSNRVARSTPRKNILDRLLSIRPPTPQSIRNAFSSSHNDDHISEVLDMSYVEVGSVSSTLEGDSETSSLQSHPSLASLSIGSSSYGIKSLQRETSTERERIGIHQHTLPSLSSIVEDCSVQRRLQRSPSPRQTVPKKPRHEYQNTLYNAVSSGAAHSDVKSILEHEYDDPVHQPKGSIPALHVAIERYDTPLHTLLMLLESNPAAAAVRVNDQDAVDLIWMRFVSPADYRSQSTKDRAAHLRSVMQDVIDGALTHYGEARAHHALQEYPDLRDLWDTMCTFIYAANHGYIGVYSSDSLSLKIVHDAIQLNCDPLFIRFAAFLYPKQLRQHNQTGQLPLHLAVMCGSPETIVMVLRLNSQASTRKDHTGKLPLHLAIDAGVTWHGGLLALIRANPRSLSIPCPVTALLPCMLAASLPVTKLTTIYSLLLENPIEICRFALDK